MSILKELNKRSGNKCELCGATNELQAYEVPPKSTGELQHNIITCPTCREQINNPDKMDSKHWRSLSDSMWSETAAVQVVAHRMLSRLKAEGWAQDLLDMLYLDEETLEWAKDTYEEEKLVHVDSNGEVLSPGDTVTLIKDLKVKGANFTAKRGTAVRRITLSRENPEHIGGRINGQQIVILTQYVKKS